MPDEEIVDNPDQDTDDGFDEPEPHLEGDDSILAERYNGGS